MKIPGAFAGIVSAPLSFVRYASVGVEDIDRLAKVADGPILRLCVKVD
jgi:hypothetical protein